MENDLMKTQYGLKKDPDFGYEHLDPLPTKKQLEQFYEREYYQHIQKTGRGSHDAKLISKDNEVRAKELEWLEKTYFIDKLDILNKFVPANKRKILDIGCGSGEFLEFMKNSDWKTFGIEPSKEVFEKAKEKGITVYNLTLEEFFAQKKKEGGFNAIVLANVLEHVLKPKETIMISKELLYPGGVICIQVPNDFNQLQLLASSKVNKKKWWIATPDHINYFNFQSLENLLKFYDFEILLKTTDFPMELFLLMEEDYVDNPGMGKLCHQKRINFELSISKELRRNFYNKLAEVGLGRQCIIYARKI